MNMVIVISIQDERSCNNRLRKAGITEMVNLKEGLPECFNLRNRKLPEFVFNGI